MACRLNLLAGAVFAMLQKVAQTVISAANLSKTEVKTHALVKT